MSVLTSRYTSSPETAFGVDVRNINEQGASSYLDTLEKAELSDAFWDVGLPQQMDTSVASSPYFNVFLASQVNGNDRGFLSSQHSVSNLLQGSSHIHHIFPRNYLKKKGVSRNRYNQIANYVVIQSEINILIADRAPGDYFQVLREQCERDKARYGNITNADQLNANFTEHCIPEGIHNMDFEDYDIFLQKRRSLMSAKIRDYYQRL